MNDRWTPEQLANQLVANPDLRFSRPSTASAQGVATSHRPAALSPAEPQILPKAIAKGSIPRRIPGQMNKTEALYAETILEPRKLAGEILDYWFEQITLKIADDCRYTPDFLVMLADASLECHEIKAEWANGQRMKDDARVKLKVAAQIFPFRFFLCIKLPKKQGGQWLIKEV